MKQKKMSIIARYARFLGFLPGALEPVVETVDKLPEFQRGWYTPDGAGKFKLDLTKVEVEDVTGLKNTVRATREEVLAEKRRAKEEVEKALEPYKGIDPVRVRGLLSQFEDKEEAELIAKGPEGIKQVVERRNAKFQEDFTRKLTAAEEKAQGALEIAQSFMNKVRDNHVRAEAAAMGMHAGAIEDALLRAGNIFTVDDDGNPVQYEDDGETIVMGKDGKTPYSVKEWLESMREKAPHWFPANGTGGGSMGNRGTAAGKVDYSGLSPVERITKAREAMQQQQRR